MRNMIKVFIIFLIGYLIYAFVVSVLIFAFKNPNVEEKFERFPEKGQLNNKDRVQLIESPEHGAMVRINLIENAENTIDITYFTFRDGQVARMILGSVLDAADRGVEVRILLDSLSLLPSLRGEYKDILYGLDSHENINFKFYDPINPLFPFTWNKRLHDKIIIIDDKLALMGGRNVADNYYFKDIKGKTFSNDRDVVIFKDETLGDYHSVIEDITNYYDDTWNYKYSKAFRKKLNSREKSKSTLACEGLKLEYSHIKDKYKEELNKVNWSDHTIAVDNIDFVHNPVGKINQDPWCLRELLFLSSQAEKSIFMQSPYFITTRRVRSTFNQYDIDVEKTKILTNSYYSSPNYLGISAYSNHRKNMIDNGVNIYEYQGKGSLHGKAYIFDNSISALGSFNLDARSSYINSESLIVIFSEEFADKLNKNIQDDLDKSLKVGKDYSYILNNKINKGKVSKLKKISIVVLSKITPILEHLL